MNIFAAGIYELLVFYTVKVNHLSSIPGIRKIIDFHLEYMYLVCSGVVRKVLNLWKSGLISLRRPNILGNINVWFSSITVRNVSIYLCEIAKSVPCEFSKKLVIKWASSLKSNGVQTFLFISYTSCFAKRRDVFDSRYIFTFYDAVYVAMRILTQIKSKCNACKHVFM